jgi:hypothetical protein
MMETLSVDCDLSDNSLEDASSQLRYIVPKITVSRHWCNEAKRLANLRGFSWDVDPEYEPDEWSLTVNGQTVGSPGA